MANNYYNFTTPFVPGTKVRSDDVNTEYAGIEDGFDLLPDSATALVLGTATLGTEVQGATVNEYDVTMPDTRLANAEGDHIAFKATHTNTAAPVINVDGIGDVSVVRPDGLALVAGDLVTDLYYEFRYDAANTRFQMVTVATSYLTAAQAAAVAAAASEANAATSETNAATSETNAATSETNAAADAALAQEWAVNVIDDDVTGFPGQYSALHWADGAAQAWAIQAEDSAIQVSFGGDGATTFSAFHWAQKAMAAGVGGSVVDLLITDTEVIDLVDVGNPLNIGAVSPAAAQHLAFDLSGIQSKSDGTNAATININSLGGQVEIGAQSGSGSVRFWNDGFIKAQFNEENFFVRGDSTGGAGNSHNTKITLEDQDGVDLFLMGFDSALDFQFDSLNDGAQIQIRANDSGSTLRNILIGDPGDDVKLYDIGVEVARTLPAASGGFEINNTLTGGGFERVLTTSDSGVAANVVGSLGNDPTAGGIQDANLQFENSVADPIANLGFDGGTVDIKLRNLVHGGDIQIWGENGSGVAHLMLNCDPDAGATLYYTSLVRVNTISTGMQLRSGVADPTAGAAQATHIRMMNESGAGSAIFGFNPTAADLAITNNVHGGQVILSGEATAGTARTLLVADPDAQVELYSIGVLAMQTLDFGISVRPSNQADDQDIRIRFQEAAGAVKGELGYNGDDTLRFVNLEHGELVAIQAEDTGGTLRNLMLGDADGEVSLWFAGNQRAATITNGIDVTGNTGNDPATGGSQSSTILLTNTSGATAGSLGWNSGGTVLRIENNTHGGSVRLLGESSGGTLRNLIDADPDDDVICYHAGAMVTQTLTAANGGLQVNNTSTGAGFERVLTTSDLGGTVITEYKNSTTSRGSTTVLADDPDLINTSLTAFDQFALEMVLFPFSTSATPDFKFDIDSDASFDIQYQYSSVSSGAAVAADTVFSGADNSITLAASINYAILVQGYFSPRSGSTSFRLRWAQDTSDATVTQLRVGSWLKLTKLN